METEKTMETERTTVEMTAEEIADYAAYKEEKARKAAEKRAQDDRKTYRQMVDDEVDSAIPELLALSGDIKQAKKTVIGNFKSIIEMKSDVLGLAKDDQRSHTFTNSEGDKRITLGVYVTDSYRDTVEDGISIVKEYIESLADSGKTRSLVSMVLKLLSKDAKGSLKASRIIQLRRIADESGDGRFLEGVRIIEEAYQPAVSKQYVKAEMKDEDGRWITIPLGMTEA